MGGPDPHPGLRHRLLRPLLPGHRPGRPRPGRGSLALTGLGLALAYLIGAIPVGYLIARARGVDVRHHGSGNIGATNVLRTSGWGPAMVTLAGDVLKGYLAARLGGSVAGGEPAATAAAAVLPVVGNCWSIFLRGRGGKGVATGLGAFLQLTPWALLPAACAWLALVATFRFVSLGSICAVLGLPLAILALGYPWPHVAAGAAVAAIVLLRHRENVTRLLAGTERRLGEKDQPAPPSPPAVAGTPR